MRIRFNRWFWHEPKGATPRRLASARRAQQRRNDKVALFPEYHDTEPPEQTIKRIDDWSIKDQEETRAKLATTWRMARGRLRTMTPDKRDQFLGWWNRCGYPGDADTFHRVLTQFAEGKLDLDGRISNLRYIRTLGFYKSRGAGRVTREWWLYGDPATDMRDPRVWAYPIAEGAD